MRMNTGTLEMRRTRDPLPFAVRHCIITGATGSGKSCLVHALASERVRVAKQNVGRAVELMLLEGWELSSEPWRLETALASLSRAAREKEDVERVIVLDEIAWLGPEVCAEISNRIRALERATVYVVAQGMEHILKIPILMSLDSPVLLAAGRELGTFVVVDGLDTYGVTVSVAESMVRILEAEHPRDPYRFVRGRVGQWVGTFEQTS